MAASNAGTSKRSGGWLRVDQMADELLGDERVGSRSPAALVLVKCVTNRAETLADAHHVVRYGARLLDLRQLLSSALGSVEAHLLHQIVHPVQLRLDLRLCWVRIVNAFDRCIGHRRTATWLHRVLDISYDR